MTVEEALGHLADQTADAVVGVLQQFCGEEVERGAAAVLPAGSDPFSSIPTPAVASNVSYVDGISGGNVFVVSLTGARNLAARMMGSEPTSGEDELSELELSAVAEAANQMMAAAAAATSTVLGQEVSIAAPETRMLGGQASDARYERTPHATSVPLVVLGEPCRLIQLVPNAFVVRMTRALDDLATDLGADPTAPTFSADALRDVRVRVSAELGRATLPLGELVTLPERTVVELDHGADDPVDLFVNGRRFASGRLILVDGDWAVRVEAILDPTELATTVQGGIA